MGVMSTYSYRKDSGKEKEVGLRGVNSPQESEREGGDTQGRQNSSG